MNTILAKGKELFGKAALAAAAFGGFLAFFGAGTASARPVHVYARPHAVFVARGYYGPRYYYGPRRVYVGPAYRSYYRPHRVYRFWDERDHCWRYR